MKEYIRANNISWSTAIEFDECIVTVQEPKHNPATAKLQ